MAKKKKLEKNNNERLETTAFSKEDWFGPGRKNKKRSKKTAKKKYNSISSLKKTVIEQ